MKKGRLAGRFGPDRIWAMRLSERTVYRLALAAAAVWLGSILAAPLLVRSGAPGPAAFIYAVCSTICHQIDSRCIHFAGRALPVCARCLGIYSGLLAGLVGLRFTRFFPRPPLPRVRTIFLMALPMAFDAGLGILGLVRTPNFLHFLTGTIFGLVLMPCLLVAVDELAGLLAGKRRIQRMPAGSRTGGSGL